MRKRLLNALACLVIVFVFVIGVYLVYTYTPIDENYPQNGFPIMGVDWKLAFRPAILSILNGENPYDNWFFFNPVWILLPLFPVALLSPELGSAVVFMISLFLYLYIAMRLKMNVLLFCIFILFSPAKINLVNGNIDALIALGFILPPQVGLFFVLAKPQLGIAVALFWAIESYREGGIRECVRVFLPVTVSYLLSFLMYGLYVFKTDDLLGVGWNASIFPYGLPIGVILLGLAVWKRDQLLAIASSPFFAPYITIHGYAFVWLGILAWNSMIFEKTKLTVSHRQLYEGYSIPFYYRFINKKDNVSAHFIAYPVPLNLLVDLWYWFHNHLILTKRKLPTVRREF